MDEKLFPGGYLSPASGIAVSKGSGQLEAETSSLMPINSGTVCKSRPITDTLTGKLKSNGSQNCSSRLGGFGVPNVKVSVLTIECH